MSKNFIVSYVTDVDTGIKIKEFAKRAGLSMSSFSALATKVFVSAMPCDIFQATKPGNLESLLSTIVAKGCEAGAMGNAS